MAFEIAGDLAAAGAVVVSGLALGIDGTAHSGALSAKGKTVAVLGNGVDCAYPSAHRKLASAVSSCGDVISEFPPRSSPERWNFPIRNRIISGMSHATVVIEADEKSGALITGRSALSQGRNVYALPGNVDEENTYGITLLIKEGAKPICCADDVLDDFNSVYDGKVNIFKLLKRMPIAMEATLSKYGVQSRTAKKSNAKCAETIEQVETSKKKLKVEEKREPKTEKKDNSDMLNALEPAHKEIYDKIPEDGEVEIDVIVGTADVSEVMSALTCLEIYGLVSILPGNKVKRT